MLFHRKEGRQISIFVAFGANLPGHDGATPRQVLERAVHVVSRIDGLRDPVRSRWFSSAPVPASDQPRYLNGVLRLAGEIDPAVLLERLRHIEAAEGRARGAPNAARSLDLDIVAVGGLVRDAPDPILPHPRAHERAFVLLPLRDVAPDWVHPRSGAGIGALIAALPAQDIRPI